MSFLSRIAISNILARLLIMFWVVANGKWNNSAMMFLTFIYAEAVSRKCSAKKVFLKIRKIYRKTLVPESPFSCRFIKRRFWYRCFLINFCEIFKNLFLKLTSDGASIYSGFCDTIMFEIHGKIDLRTLTGKKHPQIKLQRFRKVWTFRWLVHQINSLSKVLKLKQNTWEN